MKHYFLPILITISLCSCTNEDYQEVYSKKCQNFESRINQDKYCDIDFIGDSITEGYDVESYYPEFKVANRGISGDTTDMLLTRMEVSAFLLEPKVINLLIGTNNLDTCLNNYEAILQGFNIHLPNTKVTVISILPRRGEDLCAKIVDINASIKLLAEKYFYTYIDLYDSFVEGGAYQVNDSLFKDGLHPNKNGYQIITETLKPLYANWLNN